MMKSCYFLIAASLTLTGCVNINYLIERGHYDEAIEILTRKLAGKKNKKQKHVLALEYAFKKAQETDLNQEKGLRGDDDEAKWETLQDLYQRIDKRQSLVLPLTPLYSSDGYQASFRFVHLEELKNENKKNLASYYYNRALELLEASAKNRDKAAARNAYGFLMKIDNLYSAYQDVASLKNLAKERGTIHHLVTVVNESATLIPFRVEDELRRISVNDLNTAWRSYDAHPNPHIQYDYKITMRIRDIRTSPEREKSRVFDEVQEVETEEDVLDNKGRAVKDSTGKVLKQKVVTKYVSTLEEVIQLKTLLLAGRIEWLDTRTHDVDYSRPIEVEAVFENQYAKLVRGNEKYLSKETRDRLRGAPMPFPTEEELLLIAADKLKKIMKDKIKER